jgi:alpha-beta hydrolase superfamily lysophospholipase
MRTRLTFALSTIICLGFLNLTASADTLDLAPLKASLPQLSFSSPPPTYAKPVLDYFAYYGLGHAACTHYFGTFRSGGYLLAGHVYKQDSCLGTVFLIHGFYDHAGILKNLISLCLDEKFCVAVFDLPGHGLSSGEPAAIDSFAEYSNAFADFVALCDVHVPRPYAAIGHSTGCAVLLSRLFFAEENRFSRVILLAPLVRSEYWTLSKAGYAISPFAKNLPRWMRNESHDPAFLERFNRDPLQAKLFPVRWATALYSWEARIDTVTPRRLPVSIVQGTADKTVDWRYNIPFLQRKIPGCDVTTIRGARHHLINETAPYREKCLEKIREILRTL